MMNLRKGETVRSMRSRGSSKSDSRLVEQLATRFDASVLDGSEDGARIRLSVEGQSEWDLLIAGTELRFRPGSDRIRYDVRLMADRPTWESIVDDARGGMVAYRSGKLIVRHNLHLGVAFLAATSGVTGRERLQFERVRTRSGELSIVSAGYGEPVLLIHGLGATKVSFLTTLLALSDRYRVTSVDLPGFGDSSKPLKVSYHPPFFAKTVIELMNALGMERPSIVGNSMGGRVALELGLRHPERVQKLALVCPSLAWRKKRTWAPLVGLLRPELGLAQLVPKRAVERSVRRIVPGAESGWVQAGVDEFLRAYRTPRGRYAFYSAARNIYLEEPHGAKGFWTRLSGLRAPALFIFGMSDQLVPVTFADHVKNTLPDAPSIVLDCGHVPQLERPEATHAAIRGFLADAPVTGL